MGAMGNHGGNFEFQRSPFPATKTPGPCTARPHPLCSTVFDQGAIDDPPQFTGPARPPYSPSRRIGNLLWTSGVVGYHADRTLDETLEEQVHVTFENLVALLKGQRGLPQGRGVGERLHRPF
jgi:enamine deaminase RidA (YjgF/YER057c/UK114 family)